MNLRYKPYVVKQLKRLPPQQQKKIIRKLKLLASDPQAGKPLKGELEGLRSLRAWPYRIIYEIREDTLVIYSVAHRQSAYK